MSVIIFILILGLLIFVHELGHFAVAKFFGIRVDEFGMGFPPRAAKLFSYKGTDYTLNWIPFGGFVKIHGEDSLPKDDPDFGRSMMAKAWWKQILVLVAGVTMNILLAWILFSGSFMIGAPTPASQAGDVSRLKDPKLTVLEVRSGSPAERAGFMPGDHVVKTFTDNAILTNATQEGFTSFIQATEPGQEVSFTIEREGEIKELVATPDNTTVSGVQTVGVAIDQVGIYRFRFFQSFVEGAKTVYYSTINTVVAFGKLISGKMSLNGITGPVGLVGVVGDAQKIGFSYLVILAAIISINLAVVNILPFPALDGGRVLFVIIEKIIRRPLPQKFVEWANGIGFMLLIGLMLVVTVKDVIKLF